MVRPKTPLPRDQVVKKFRGTSVVRRGLGHRDQRVGGDYGPVPFTVRLILPTRSKPLAVWLYTSTVTAPALSPTSGPDRLVWSVGNGTPSVVPPVRLVARACPTSTPSPTKFTTGNPAPRFAKPFPLIVKLPGAAARSV